MAINEQFRTAHLSIVPFGGEEDLSGNEREIAEILASFPPKKEGARFYDLLLLREKKSRRAIGCVQISDVKDPHAAEIDLSLVACRNGEKYACEALKGAARAFFRRHRGLFTLETWVNPDLSSIRILEKSGYDRVFESEGVVRYEKTRARFPFLAFFMLLFTGAGFLAGTFFDNYPLFTVIGITAGIIPGSVAEKIASKIRRKKR